VLFRSQLTHQAAVMSTAIPNVHFTIAFWVTTTILKFRSRSNRYGVARVAYVYVDELPILILW
jgi:hypothetical protein